jgi:hypothetical protein
VVLGDIMADRELSAKGKGSDRDTYSTRYADSLRRFVIESEGLEFVSIENLVRPVGPGPFDDGLSGLSKKIDVAQRVRGQDSAADLRGESFATFSERPLDKVDDFSLKFLVKLILSEIRTPVDDSA